MEYTEIQKIIEKAKSEYKTIGKVFCPYLGQEVWFTMKGFKHLISSNGRQRADNIIKDRLDAIKYIPEIIYKSGTLQEYENTYREYFSLIAILKSNKYKVILFKDIDNKYKFFSIIPNYITNFRDKLKIYPKWVDF